MSDETKIVKLVKPGEPPKGNTAKVTKSKLAQSDLAVQKANRLVRDAGGTLKPFGCKYLGSATIHYYIETNTEESKPVYKTLCQTQVSEIDEGLADFGWKRLQESLMEVYGRKVPTVRG